MYEYIEPYIIGDKVLLLFSENNTLPNSDIETKVGNSSKNWRSALVQLEQDKLVIKDAYSGYFTLTGKGYHLIENGLYKAHLERKNNSYELKKKTNRASLLMAKSSIKVNSAMVKNIKKNNLLYWLTFFVAFVGAISTAISALISYQQKIQLKTLVEKETEIQLLKTKLSQKENALIADSFLIDSLRKISPVANKITKPNKQLHTNYISAILVFYRLVCPLLLVMTVALHSYIFFYYSAKSQDTNLSLLYCSPNKFVQCSSLNQL